MLGFVANAIHDTLFQALQVLVDISLLLEDQHFADISRLMRRTLD